jgi:hypothetical protein
MDVSLPRLDDLNGKAGQSQFFATLIERLGQPTIV